MNMYIYIYMYRLQQTVSLPLFVSLLPPLDVCVCVSRQCCTVYISIMYTMKKSIFIYLFVYQTEV